MIRFEGNFEGQVQALATKMANALRGPDHVDILVPSNSAAGDYAKKMHDEKGRTWKNRGVGTVAKGPQADEKYIERAIEDRTDATTRRFERAEHPLLFSRTSGWTTTTRRSL